jgi:hypothetical protein
MSASRASKTFRWVAATAVVAVAVGACGSSDDTGSVDTASRASAPSATQPTSEAPAETDPTTVAVVTTDAAPETTTIATDPAAASGWAIHDSITSEQSGLVTEYDAISCDSESGPWHIVASFDVPGNLTQDVFYDVTFAADGTGPVTGEEHTTWDDGSAIDGTYIGTATLTPSADAFTLTVDYDESISITDPISGAQSQDGHRTKELAVGPAAAGECG